MKVSKFLNLSAMALFTTAAFAKVSPPKMDEEYVTRSPATALAKRAIETNYSDLKKQQRQQRISARKARAEKREYASKLNMIKALPAEVDTLNVANYMMVLHMYPKAKNPRLARATKAKMTAIRAEEGPRDSAAAQLRKAQYIQALDQMFFRVNQDAKHWELDKYGQRQVVKASHPDVRNVFEKPFRTQNQQIAPQVQEPRVRKFALRKEYWINTSAAAA